MQTFIVIGKDELAAIEELAACARIVVEMWDKPELADAVRDLDQARKMYDSVIGNADDDRLETWRKVPQTKCPATCPEHLDECMLVADHAEPERHLHFIEGYGIGAKHLFVSAIAQEGAELQDLTWSETTFE